MPDSREHAILPGDVWRGVGGWTGDVRVVSTHSARVFGFKSLRVMVIPTAGATEEVQCGAGAFEGATLVSRLRPDPPPELTEEMGSPDFVVCGCGRVARARAGTAVPRVHRCPHGQKCSGRPLCETCLSVFEALEGGSAATDPYVYVLTFKGHARDWSLVIVSGRSPDAIGENAEAWREQLEERTGPLHNRVQLDRWRCGLPPPNG